MPPRFSCRQHSSLKRPCHPDVMPSVGLLRVATSCSLLPTEDQCTISCLLFLFAFRRGLTVLLSTAWPSLRARACVFRAAVKPGHLRITALQPILLTHPPPPRPNTGPAARRVPAGLLWFPAVGRISKALGGLHTHHWSGRAVEPVAGSMRVQEGLTAGLLAGDPCKHQVQVSSMCLRSPVKQTAGDRSIV